MKALLLLILMLAVPFSFAAEMCVVDGVLDYICYDSVAILSQCPQGTSPATCCTDLYGAGARYVVAPMIPECTPKCCCDGAFAVQDDPMSQSRCQDERVGNSNIQILPSGNSCDAVCSQSGGSGTTSVTVSGVVTADGVPVQGAQVTHTSGLLDLTVTQGRYSIAGVIAAPSASFTASYAGCSAQTQTIDLSSGQDQTLSFTLTCGGGSSCTPVAVTDTRVTIDRASGDARIVWTPDTCSQITGYAIYRCDSTGSGCSGLEEPIGGIPLGEAGVFIDSNVRTDTSSCYLVKPRTIDGTEITPTQSDGANCLGAISSICMMRDIRSATCFNGDVNVQPSDATADPFYGVAHCNGPTLVLDEECDYAQGEVCMVLGGVPTCTQDNICDQCNGPYGWFVDPTARSSSMTCSNLQSCVLDNAAYSKNTYVSCAQISSCYDYGSKSACEGAGIDQCRVSDGPCTWQPTQGLEETGRGVCIPQNPLPGSTQCERCEDLYGFCNDQLCSALGDCYYNQQNALGGFGEPIGCLPKNKMACAFYDDQQSCGGEVQVNVQYAGANRVGGTNSITVRSTDALGFGLCDWSGSACIKDADGDASGVDDCLEGGTSGVSVDCFSDVEPPTTTLPLWDGMELTLDQLLTITPGVTDDTYDRDSLQTKACLVPADNPPCYPDLDFANLDIVWPDETAFTLYYYSWDPAGNLEPIRSVNLFLPGEGGMSSLRLVSASVVTT